MFWNKYPYSDMHELNLDWILAEIMKLHHDYDEFKAVNTITNAGAWDITKQYQAWTIVSDNNLGYISLKPVPAGVAITNTEYWGLIADYDILITNLSQRISDLEGAVVTINSDIANINNVKIPNILSDGKIFLGDSYGVDAQAGGKAWTSYVEDTYPDAVVYPLGGTGFASDLFMADNWLTMLQSVASGITNKDAIKDIFVFGGANDGNLYFGSTATEQDIIDRIEAFCAYAKTTFPNALVYVGFVGWYKDRARFTAYKAVRNIYIKGLNLCENGCYISGLESIMKNDTFINSLDLVHPTQDGSDMLAKYILQSVAIKGNVHYHEIFDATFTPKAGVTMQGGTVAYVIYDGDTAKLIQYGSHNSYADIAYQHPSTNLAYGNFVELGDYTNTPRAGMQPLSSYLTAQIVQSDSTVTTIDISVSKDTTSQMVGYKSYKAGSLNNAIAAIIPQGLEINFAL